MFVEAIDHVLDIWTGEPPYDRDGKYWTITTERTLIPEIGQGIIVTPYQKPHPPIVVTAVAPLLEGRRPRRPSAAGSRSRRTSSCPTGSPSHWPMYAEGAPGGGRRPSREDWRVAKSIFVADDEKTAQALRQGHEGPYRFYFKQLMRKLMRQRPARALQARPPHARRRRSRSTTVLDSLCIAGTVDSVVDQILAFRERIGDFGTLSMPGTTGSTQRSAAARWS